MSLLFPAVGCQATALTRLEAGRLVWYFAAYLGPLYLD